MSRKCFLRHMGSPIRVHRVKARRSPITVSKRRLGFSPAHFTSLVVRHGHVFVGSASAKTAAQVTHQDQDRLGHRFTPIGIGVPVPVPQCGTQKNLWLRTVSIQEAQIAWLIVQHLWAKVGKKEVTGVAVSRGNSVSSEIQGVKQFNGGLG